MNITVTDTDQEKFKKEVRLEIPGDTIKSEMDKAAARYARQVSIPGFRPGHAPKSVIKTRFRNELRQEAAAQLVPQVFDEAMRERDLMLVGQPEIKEMKPGDDDSVNISFEITALPKFDGSELKADPINIQVPKVKEEEVDQVIEQMRDRQAELVPIEDRGAQPGDIVTVNLTGTLGPKPEKAASGEAAPEGEQKESEEVKAEAEEQSADKVKAEGEQTGEESPEQEDAGPEEVNQKDLEIELGADGILKEFTEALTGARVGEERTVAISYPEDYATPHYAGRSGEFKAEVTAVKVKELPELDDAFAQSVDEDLKTVEDLRADVRKRLKAERDRTAEDGVRSAVMNRLLDRYKFDVSEAAVERRMDALFQNFAEQLIMNRIDPSRLNLDWAALRESRREQAEREVRWAFILDSIGNFQKIEVSDDDLRHEIEHMAEALGQPAAALRSRLAKEDLLDGVRDQLRNRKVLDFLIASADAKVEEVDAIAQEEPAEGEEPAATEEAASDASAGNAE